MGISQGVPAEGPGARAFDAVIVGGGIIGLSVAWRASLRGLDVAVADPAPGSGASHAAAGMLAPVSEVSYTEEPLLRLGLASLARWPAFAAELEEAAGRDVDLRGEGTLDVAFGADDMAALGELAAFMDKLGLPVERLTGREARRLEPMLAPSVRGGLLAGGDSWVDPRRVTAALLAALAARGVPLLRERVTGLDVTGGEVRGVRLAPPSSSAGPGSGLRRTPAGLTGGTGDPWAAAETALGGPHGDAGGLPAGPGTAERVVRARRVVVALGAWAGVLAGVPPELVPPVRPVKGQIMRLRSAEPLLGRCVRGSVHGSSVYLVPRRDGELVVGATQEELGFDDRVTAGAVWELLRDARELVPGVTELEVADVVAGLRPGTPDNLPLIGPTALPGLHLATGHHRGGVLLAPLTAELVAGTLAGDGPEIPPACSPTRFEDIA
ncbi:glycine oxidase ThiO [Microtetraspora sp. NBRC 13810]|uniref:FAD-dependent oxidoreductase n=1 Tax=Microtetraspora sp. NBRC 13810 TaxID=3030990 RepID=UPI0024A1246B|nr:FAD-dependent oxidoreductase [Microtetraspora sp. NBRC 13810]GLW12103.1 glycine oxidase ThiO [Microtetraspora sp. NBRC 13810]